MGNKIFFVVLLSVTFECYGHLPSLTGILNDAHKRVHSTVHGVANSVLGGGFDLNFGAHIDTLGQGNYHHGSPQRPQSNNDETIVVVVDEAQPNHYGNDYNRPPGSPFNMQGHNNNNYHPYYQNSNPNYNHNQIPHQNYGNPQQNNNGNSNYNNQNQHGNNQDNFDTNSNGNYDYGNQGQNMHGFGQNKRPTQNHYGNQEQPTQGYNNNNKQTTQGYDQNNHGTDDTETEGPKPDYGNSEKQKNQGQTPPIDKSTKNPDEPLSVPLNPNEYVYGGDKITVTGPKRETDDADKESDEDYAIDTRFKGQ